MADAQTYAGKAARAATILVSSQAVILGFQFLGDLVLARLLAPADFGLLTMVMAVTGFAMQFKDFGLSAAGIQAPTLSERQASNLFWCNISISLLMTLGFTAAAPVVEQVYGKPHLAAITAGMSLAFVLAGLGVQHQAQLTRQLRFGAISRCQVAGVIVGYLAAIAGALAGLHYWSLVLLQLVRPAVSTVGLYLAHPWMPSRPARGQGTLRLLRFGTAMAGFDLVNYFSRNADKFLIGRLNDAAVLGYYNRAYQFLLLPIAQVRGPVVAAGMPMLSALQGKPAEFRRLFLGMVNLIASLALPLLCWMALLSRELTVVLFGVKWLPSVEYFRILAVAGLVQPTIGLLGLLMVTLGLGGRYFKWGCWHSGTMVISFLVGIRWGVPGLTIAYAAANFVAAGPSVWFCTRGTPVSVPDFLQAHLIPGAFALAASAVAWAGISLWATPQLWERLATGTVLFAAVYLSQLALLKSRRGEVRWLAEALLKRKLTREAVPC